MNLKDLFKNKKKPLLNIYFTAGFPHIGSMLPILEGLETAGVDIVEIGLPYSDPLSDGPTIQKSSSIAIQNGITTDFVFEQLSITPTTLPKIIMGYFNAIFLYGVEAFCQKCKACNISGVILPDLPIDVYLEQYQSIFNTYEIDFIFLITPETSEDRIRQIDAISNAFIYAVSSSSTTGNNKGIKGAKSYLERLQNMNLSTPLMVGFNISSKEDFEFATSYTAGGIIGSAFIKHIAESQQIKTDTIQFVQSITSKNKAYDYPASI